MSEPIVNILTCADQPGPDEMAHACEPCALLTHEMILTSTPHMVVVRIFGADSMRNAVRIGATAERARRIGQAFLRAADRIDPPRRATEGGGDGV